ATPACDLSFGAKPEEGLPSYFLETDLKGGSFTFDWLIERLLTRPGGAPSSAQAAGADAASAGATGADTPSKRQRLEQLARLAEQIPPGSEGLMLVPYLNGVMNPYWDDLASGVLVGLRGHHGPAHLYRAICE